MFPPQKDVKEVFTAIGFEVAYSLGKHVVTGHQERDLPALEPVLRWRKGDKIAVRNEVKYWRRYNALLDIYQCTTSDLMLVNKIS